MRPCGWSPQLPFTARQRLDAVGVEAVQDVQSVRELFWKGSLTSQASATNLLAKTAGPVGGQQQQQETDVLRLCSVRRFEEATRAVCVSGCAPECVSE